MDLRALPSVDRLANSLEGGDLPRPLVVEVARRALADARAGAADGASPDPEAAACARLAELRGLRPGRIINATGVLLHTNLGRAGLHPMAAAAAAEAARHAGNVELDPTTGTRHGRGGYVAELLRLLTGAEDALVVNNNAGALFLALAALAAGRQVMVSRGELIEIGGSFRLPELMAASGAWLVEVGTTNRTRVADYENACSDSTALVLKIHASNYRIEGFTEEAGYGELAAVASRAGVSLVADIGSGLLDERVPWLAGPPPSWLAGEPGAVQVVDAGADLVLFSGDKLLGGPQAGIVVGRRRRVERLRRHPVARAMRCDGPTLAALAATLELYAGGRGAEVPFWRQAALDYAGLEERTRELLAAFGQGGSVEPGESLAGAGSLPTQAIPSPVLRIPAAERAWRALLTHEPAVLTRRHGGDLVVDLRAVEPEDDGRVAAALQQACRS